MNRKVRLLELKGKTFNSLTLVSSTEKRTDRGHILWECLCVCGKKCYRIANDVFSGKAKSCGCIKLSVKHGLSGTRIRDIWHGMHDRCYNTKSISYKNYGGKGITVCKEWFSLEKFYEDLGNPPCTNYTLDRNDNSLPYCKENCKWSTQLDQGKNKISNKYFTINGKTKHLAEWCRDYGIIAETVSYRIKKLGWDFETALKTSTERNRKEYREL